ncbi:MAG: putative dehydrogenase [Pseudohongiellaceae bacterium]|jgi:predicted dehydrogenase
MTDSVSRRQLLRAAAGAAVVLPLLGSAGCVSTNRRVTQGRMRHGAVGCGGMGGSDLAEIASHPDVDIVALCDVDSNNLAKAAELHPQARLYRDWRVMLATEDGALDSVHVTVPDHMHAPIMLDALDRGLHVYGQKPLTRTVAELRAVVDAARRAGVATQMGIQNRANVHYLRSHELFLQGHIGKVHEVHVWTDRPTGWWPQGVGRPTETSPVPEALDWDLWLGVAPKRPFVEGSYHPFSWRGWKDFGTGAQGDMACHLMDPALWFLELGLPSSLRSDGPAPNNETYPLWSRVHMEYEPTEHTTRGPLQLTWYDGGRKPNDLLKEWGAGEDVYANACLFIGTEGALLASPYDAPRLLPEDRFVDVPLPPAERYNHWHNWVDACLGRSLPSAPFEYAGLLSESALLGNVALHFPHETLRYDGDDLSFKGRPEATALLYPDYRNGFALRG